jgi:aminoglycoside 6'-N-acetyltransferase I
MMGTAMATVVEIRILGEGDAALLQACANGVFDHSRSPELLAEFLADARHHIVAAIVDRTLVGFVSAVHYVHPDKQPELWINEVSVAESHRGQGMLSHGRSLGCTDGAHRNVVYFTFPLIDSQ